MESLAAGGLVSVGSCFRSDTHFYVSFLSTSLIFLYCERISRGDYGKWNSPKII